MASGISAAVHWPAEIDSIACEPGGETDGTFKGHSLQFDSHNSYFIDLIAAGARRKPIPAMILSNHPVALAEWRTRAEICPTVHDVIES